MMRLSFLGSALSLIVGLTLSLPTAGQLFAQSTAPTIAPAQQSQPSVSEMVSMLKAIDPYLPSKEPMSGKISIYGSTSMDALAHVWKDGFNEFHKDVKIEIAASGSVEAFDQLAASPSSIAMVSYPVRNEELASLKSKGLKNPVAFVVAREALGIFVHKSNPVQSMTGEQMRALFTNDAKADALTWGQFGATGEWSTKPVHVIARTETSGTQVFLRDFVFGGSKMREATSKHASNAEVLTAIAADPMSIAICGLKSTGSSVRALSLKSGTTSIPSDEHAVLSGQYPLTRALTIVIDMGQTDANSAAAREYVHFAMCQTGQAAAIGASCFPVELPILRANLNKLQGEQLR